MTVDEALALLDAVLSPERLSDVQSLVFRHAWEGLTYERIATVTGYDDDYVRDVGARLWQRLSKASGERVSKTNLQSALRRCRQQRALPVPIEEASSLPVRECEPAPPAQAQTDWGEAVDVSIFYGRTEELACLHDWIVVQRCRLVALLGSGGVGKTSLAVRFAQQWIGEFGFVFWRSLRNAPPLSRILADLLALVEGPQAEPTQENLDAAITRLLGLLRQHRCLIVLDNCESLLEAGGRFGTYRRGAEPYGEWFRRIGETVHSSCLLLTSREKSEEVAILEGDALPVRVLPLQGLPEAEGLRILKDKGLVGNDASFRQLSAAYQGSPLALKLVGTSIRDIFAGDIAQFLGAGAVVFNGLRQLLEQQFQRLSPLEQQVMFWLALGRDGVSVSQLHDDILPPVSRQRLLEALEFLRRRFLIESVLDTALGVSGFTQQPVVMEYVTEQVVECVTAELSAGFLQGKFVLDSFEKYPLLQATVRDDIREAQVELFLKPVAQNLAQTLSSRQAPAHFFETLCAHLRDRPPGAGGYAGGNLLNLMRYLELNLCGQDFSGLTIRQADLRNLALHNANFSRCDLSGSAFSHAFGAILAVAASPDGQWVVAGDSNGEVRGWQLQTNHLRLTGRGHTNWVTTVAFSPDGQTIASGSLDHTLRLWDSRTGQCLQMLHGHSEGIWSVAFSPDGSLIASGSSDRTVRLWADGSTLCALEGHTGWVQAVAFHPDGRTLASAGQDRIIRLWDVTSGTCLRMLEGHTHPIWDLAFTPDGALLITGSVDGTVTFWEARTGQCLNTSKAHGRGVFALAVSPDGGVLATGSDDLTVRLWDIQTRQGLKVLHGHTARIWSLAFRNARDTPETGYTLVSGGDDHALKVWDTGTRRCLGTIQGYSSAFWSVAYGADGRLASGSEDRNVRLWDLETGACLNMTGHSSWVMGVAFSPDGQWVASGSDDYTARIWESNTGRCLAVLSGHTHPVRSVAFSADGTVLVTGSADHTIKIWDLSGLCSGRAGRCQLTLEAHRDWIFCVATSASNALVASGSSDRTVRVWNLRTGQCLRTLTGHTGTVWSVAFHPDKPMLVSGSEDRTLRLWDLQTGACLQVLESPGAVCTVAFSPDGRLLASGSNDHSASLWDTETGRCVHTLCGHTSCLWSVQVSPDGRQLATASQDETIRVWSVHTGQCLQVLRPKRLYEQMNISGATGLTELQRATLQVLGAVDTG